MENLLFNSRFSMNGHKCIIHILLLFKYKNNRARENLSLALRLK